MILHTRKRTYVSERTRTHRPLCHIDTHTHTHMYSLICYVKRLRIRSHSSTCCFFSLQTHFLCIFKCKSRYLWYILLVSYQCRRTQYVCMCERKKETHVRVCVQREKCDILHHASYVCKYTCYPWNIPACVCVPLCVYDLECNCQCMFSFIEFLLPGLFTEQRFAWISGQRPVFSLLCLELPSDARQFRHLATARPTPFAAACPYKCAQKALSSTKSHHMGRCDAPGKSPPAPESPDRARATSSDPKQISRDQKISTNQHAHTATTRRTKDQATDKKPHLEP